MGSAILITWYRVSCVVAVAVSSTLALTPGTAFAVEPPGTYVITEPPRTDVYFEFESDRLSPQDKEVIRSAVHFALANGLKTARAIGYADTAEGSGAHSTALSLRRAATVRKEMACDGFDASKIRIEGKGFHEPLVPTGPDVREPQNRRALMEFDP